VAVLCLCAASVGFSLFVRQTDGNGHSRALRLAVENGSDVKGVAGDAGSALAAMGIDVVSTGNAARR
jgi:hypothetical protein